MKIFSHGGELGAACEMCGRKYVHKHYSAVKAGHLLVCMDAGCIIDAMRETGVPKLALSEDFIIKMISEECNVSQTIVKFHLQLAKAVYQFLVNPNVADLETTYLLEAILSIEFSDGIVNDIRKYTETIDVLMKPYGMPLGRKVIDTNYPLTSVIMMSRDKEIVPGFLEDVRNTYHSKGDLHYEMRGYDNLLSMVDLMSGMMIPECGEIPVSKQAIILGQLYMNALGYISIYSEFEIFSKCMKTGGYDRKGTQAMIKSTFKKVNAIVDNKHKTYMEKMNGIYELLDSIFNETI